MIFTDILLIIGFGLTAFFLLTLWRIIFLVVDLKKDISLIRRELK